MGLGFCRRACDIFGAFVNKKGGYFQRGGGGLGPAWKPGVWSRGLRLSDGLVACTVSQPSVLRNPLRTFEYRRSGIRGFSDWCLAESGTVPMKIPEEP